MVTYPYQRLFIDFFLSGQISYDKEGNWEDIQIINGEKSLILISDMQNKMFYGDINLRKALLINNLESFLQEYSPNVSKKFVALDQMGESYHYP